MAESERQKMKCFYCDTKVRWNNDFDTEDTHPESEHDIVSMYECDKCKAWYEVYTVKKNKKEDK